MCRTGFFWKAGTMATLDMLEGGGKKRGKKRGGSDQQALQHTYIFNYI